MVNSKLLVPLLYKAFKKNIDLIDKITELLEIKEKIEKLDKNYSKAEEINKIFDEFVKNLNIEGIDEFESFLKLFFKNYDNEADTVKKTYFITLYIEKEKEKIRKKIKDEKKLEKFIKIVECLKEISEITEKEIINKWKEEFNKLYEESKKIESKKIIKKLSEELKKLFEKLKSFFLKTKTKTKKITIYYIVIAISLIGEYLLNKIKESNETILMIIKIALGIAILFSSFLLFSSLKNGDDENE